MSDFLRQRESTKNYGRRFTLTDMHKKRRLEPLGERESGHAMKLGSESSKNTFFKVSVGEMVICERDRRN